MEVLCVLFALVLFERVDLDAEGHALFSAVLSHGEFCADAVYLDSKQGHGGIDLKIKGQRQRKVALEQLSSFFQGLLSRRNAEVKRG